MSDTYERLLENIPMLKNCSVTSLGISIGLYFQHSHLVFSIEIEPVFISRAVVFHRFDHSLTVDYSSVKPLINVISGGI
jgi:hypothetical protein